MPSGMRDLKTKLNRRLEALRQDRHQHLAKWYDVKNYILPNNGRGLTDAEDEQEDKKPADTTFIYDSTATRALAVAAAGFQAGITSPSRPWFKLGFEDPALMRRPQVEREEDVRVLRQASEKGLATKDTKQNLRGMG